jgi:hypothetical protein
VPTAVAVESALGRFVLEDSYGTQFYLDRKKNVVLYGSDSMGWDDYGFLFAPEMVLWADGPGGDYVQSYVYLGEWDVVEKVFTGNWVNTAGSYGQVDMWPVMTQSGSTAGEGPHLAGEGAGSDGFGFPGGYPKGESNSVPRKKGRGDICFEDSNGFVWISLSSPAYYYTAT